jgi:hypothetical protein
VGVSADAYGTGPGQLTDSTDLRNLRRKHSAHAGTGRARAFTMTSDAKLPPMPAKKTAKRRKKSPRRYATPAQQAARAELIRLSGVKVDPKLLAKMRAEWEE